MKKQLIIKNEIVEMSFEEALKYLEPAIHKEINRQKSNFDRASEERDDMFQDASIWLWNAYEKYDIKKGYHFSTYAKMYIRRGVQNETMKNQTQKRDGETISMDAKLGNSEDEDFSLSNLLSEDIDFDSPMIASEVMSEAIKSMTELEVEYLSAMLNGYGVSEFARMKGTSKPNVSERFKTIKKKIKKAGYDYNY